MSDSMNGLTPLLLDAKKEYLHQLSEVLAPHILNTMHAAYVSATKSQRNARRVLAAFQEKLREIPVWNASVVAAKTSEISSRVPFLADLIAAVFVSYTKILSSIKLGADKPNIRLRLPSNEALVHQVYIHVAKEFYATPSLLRADRATRAATVRAAVDSAVRSMLPIQDILKAYLGNSIDGEDQTMNADPGGENDSGDGLENGEGDGDEGLDDGTDDDDMPLEEGGDDPLGLAGEAPEEKHIFAQGPQPQQQPQQQLQQQPQQQTMMPMAIPPTLQPFPTLSQPMMAAQTSSQTSAQTSSQTPPDPFPQATPAHQQHRRQDLFADAEDGGL
jgi:hypothetical protein